MEKKVRVRKAKALSGSTPDSTPVAPPVVATPVAAVRTGKFRGLGTVAGIPAGLRRMEFQDRLLAWNEAEGNRRTDTDLAAMMDAEHPGGCKIRPDHMRAIRRLYNEGKHTKAGVVPATLSKEYDATGAVVVATRGKKAVAKAA